MLGPVAISVFSPFSSHFFCFVRGLLFFRPCEVGARSLQKILSQVRPQFSSFCLFLSYGGSWDHSFTHFTRFVSSQVSALVYARFIGPFAQVSGVFFFFSIFFVFVPPPFCLVRAFFPTPGRKKFGPFLVEPWLLRIVFC